MDTIGSAYCAAYRACLARVVLGFLDNADAFEPGLVREHLDAEQYWPQKGLFETQLEGHRR